MTDEYLRVLDEELESQLEEVHRTDLSTKEGTDLVKNLETLSKIRLDIYQAQQAAYEGELKAQLDEQKLDLDREKAEADKRQNRTNNVFNGLIVGISAVGSVGVPLWIMSAEKRGQFWSNRALNASEKPPKLQLIRNHFSKK